MPVRSRESVSWGVVWMLPELSCRLHEWLKFFREGSPEEV